MQVQNILIDEYNYDLPNEKIANYPLEKRDASKLLIYKNNCIENDVYKNIANYLPQNAMVVFNNTKVIQARILFTKDTGAIIEIFVLEPFVMDIVQAMQATNMLQIKCFIGGASKWKKGIVLQKKLQINNETIQIDAKLVSKEEDFYVVQLQWNTNHDFATIIEAAGKMPLPPYIKRDAEILDEKRYQTIYATFNGSVAAPTAGLHFTPFIMEQLLQKNIEKCFVTLHVGAGTFKPVTTSAIAAHTMHQEYIEVTQTLINKLLLHQHNICAVGTTSVRTLESLYWLGVKVTQQPTIALSSLKILQWDAYQLPIIDKKEALHNLYNYLQQQNIETFFTTTQLLIAPSYVFKIVNIMVTNFHQPKSTLLLLVAAATNGNWKKLYNHALHNDYRFLSYGDGSIIFIEN